MESQKPESKSEEIDLAQLFARIGDSMKRGWMNFMRFLARLRRIPIENKWSFILIIIASICIGIIFTFFVRKSFYESKMILSSEFLNKTLAENIVDKLDALAREKNKAGLGIELNLPDSLADNIIGFDVRPFVAEEDVVEVEILKEQLRNTKIEASPEVIKKMMSRIEVENRHAFEITVRTLSPSVIPNLQEAVFNYFQRNPYIKKRVASNRENLLEKKKKLSRDVNKLDSLKSVMYQTYRTMAEQSRGSNNVILSDKNAPNPVELYNADLKIYEEYQEVTSDLFLQKDLEMVDGFTAFSEPASPSIGMMLLYSLLIGIVVAYIEVALRTFNKYLANLE